MTQTAQGNRDKYIEKINALLRKAESTDSQHEADALFDKAQQLMTKWAIDDLALQAAKGSEHVPLNIIRHSFGLRWTYYDEDALILLAVAVANSCRVFTTNRKPTRGEQTVILVGDAPDVERVLMLFTSLYLQMGMALDRDLHADPAYAYMERKDKKRFRISFRQGFAHGLTTRLHKAKEEAAGDFLPALVNKGQKVDDYVSSSMAIGVSKKRGRSVGAGYSGGVAAGQRADVGDGRVSGGRTGALGR